METTRGEVTTFERLIEKCGSFGFGALTKDEASMLFLCFAEYSNDVSKLYSALKDEDSCSFFELPKETLRKDGLSEAGAFLISRFSEVAARCTESLTPECVKRITAQKNAENERRALIGLIKERYVGVTSEKVLLVLIDSGNTISYLDFLNTGSGGSAIVDISRICSFAAAKKARCVVIAHNHPSGVVIPSKADCEATYKLYAALRSIGILLIDHFIVTRTKCESIRSIYDFYGSSEEHLELVCRRLDSLFT